MNMSNIQSFLILGNPINTRLETQKIASIYKINLKKISTDVTLISVNEKRQEISIDQIRDLKKNIFQKPQEYTVKFIIIDQAQKLSQEAQNAILKILEEPPKHAIIILEASNKENLLPTIRSRVQIINKFNINDKIPFDLLNYENYSLDNALLEINKIDNPSDWLDQQVIGLYKKIIADQKKFTNASHISRILSLIEECINIKKMVEANVNPKQVMSNFIFKLKINYS